MDVNRSAQQIQAIENKTGHALDSTAIAVSTVSWNDAITFCTTLSDREKLNSGSFNAGKDVEKSDEEGYRLPKEAEWEYACRAGTTTNYWIDDDEFASVGWCASNSGNHAHMAGELRANPYGLHDTHGNVWEWVYDWWSPAFYGICAENNAVNPVGSSESGVTRVLRGGGWSSHESACRAAARHAIEPNDRFANVGFRVLLPVSAIKGQVRVQRAANE